MSQVSTVIKERTAQHFGGGDPSKTAAVEGLFDLAEKFAGEGAGIIKTLLQAATVNPYLGIIASWIMADILQKARLIYPSTNALIKTTGLIVFGVTITADILGVITNLIDQILPTDALKGLIGGTSAPKELLSPSATTIVYAGDPQALESLIAKLAAVKP